MGSVRGRGEADQDRLRLHQSFFCVGHGEAEANRQRRGKVRSTVPMYVDFLSDFVLPAFSL